MSTPFDLDPKERAEFGFARVRDVAFDAVLTLWHRRQKEGMTQLELAQSIGADPAWVSRKLRGPANWTLKTFGAFIEGLKGEPDICVRAIEDHPSRRLNHHPYAGYEIETDPAACDLSPKITVTRDGNPRLNSPLVTPVAS